MNSLLSSSSHRHRQAIFHQELHELVGGSEAGAEISLVCMLSLSILIPLSFPSCHYAADPPGTVPASEVFNSPASMPVTGKWVNRTSPNLCPAALEGRELGSPI